MGLTGNCWDRLFLPKIYGIRGKRQVFRLRAFGASLKMTTLRLGWHLKTDSSFVLTSPGQGFGYRFQGLKEVVVSADGVVIALFAVGNGRVVALADFEGGGAGSAVFDLEGHGQVVFRRVGNGGVVGVNYGVFEQVGRVEGDDFSLYIDFAVGGAAPEQGRFRFPVRFCPAAEHILRDEFVVRENSPEDFCGRVDVDGLFNKSFGHAHHCMRCERAVIGKMRQTPAKSTAKVEELFDPKLDGPRGVLRHAPATEGTFRHARRSAPAELTSWVDHYWMVYWDLRGLPPRLVETLPHPNVHVVFEWPESKAWGISTVKFSRMLEGRSHAFGIKFTPGGFYPFLGKPVSTLADTSIAVGEVFGRDAEALEGVILATEDENAMVAAANDFLLQRLPQSDMKATLAGELVAQILRERDLLTVEDLAERSGMGVRSLQRLFSRYVGASPKWVIRRYRLHELLEQMHSGRQIDWAQLAVELGYFDQAHLIHDFKSMTGYAPTEYAHQQIAAKDN